MTILDRRAASLFVGALASFALSGCLDFKRQSIIIKFDDDSKKITCLLVYEGIHVARGLIETKRAALANAKKKLTEFVSSEQEFCLFGWPFDIALDRQPDDTEQLAARRRKIAGQLEIKNGAFLLDERKELSGYQTITIPDSGRFAQEVNEVMSPILDEIAAEELKKPRNNPNKLPLSDESLRLIQRAAREGHDWLRLSRGRIEIDLPMTRDDTETLLAQLEKDKSAREALQEVRKLVPGFEITRSDDGLSVVIGDGKSRVLSLLGKQKPDEDAEALFEAEFLDFARSLRPPFDRTQDTKALIERFSSTP